MMSSRARPASSTIAAVDSLRRKRVWSALESGNRSKAVKELKEVSLADEEIEAYLDYLREEEAKLTFKQYEAIRKAEDDDLTLLLDSLSLHSGNNSVLCPVCDRGQLSKTQGHLTCSFCQLRVTWPGSVEDCREHLADELTFHASKCPKNKPLITIAPDSHVLLTCDACNSRVVLF